MFLKTLNLLNYKSLVSSNFLLDRKLNCFVGSNGVGKTNVLDAIYHLAFGKSYFNTISTENITYGETFFVIEGIFSKQDKEEHVVCSFKKGHQKAIKHNGKIYDKLSEYVGFVPVVMISPSDRDLIVEGSSTRRKFIDTVISQYNKAYLNVLIDYNNLLYQRNALLKYMYTSRSQDYETISVYNMQLVEKGNYIFECRKQFISEFVPIFESRYKAISGKEECVSIQYQSQLFEGDLNTLLTRSLQRDLQLQYTSIGVHKDDLDFLMQDRPIKKNGSQGQQKSLLIALKFAQFDFVKNQGSETPILLLDDIFDKLDNTRVAHIVQLVTEQSFGQLFITDTDPLRTEHIIKQTGQSYNIITL